MAKLYSTESFLRDNYPIFDGFYKFYDKITSFFNKTSRKFLNSNFEVGATELLLQTPIFLTILLFGFLITVILVQLTEPEKGYKFVNVLTSSMSPSIKPGSIVLTAPPTNIGKNEIISFEEISNRTGQLTGRKLLHRIVDQNVVDGKRVFITKGDNNFSPDPGNVLNENILGKVVFTIPYLGFLTYLIGSWWGLLFFIFIPMVLIVYSEVSIIKKLKRTKLSRR